MKWLKILKQKMLSFCTSESESLLPLQLFNVTVCYCPTPSTSMSLCHTFQNDDHVFLSAGILKVSCKFKAFWLKMNLMVVNSLASSGHSQ